MTWYNPSTWFKPEPFTRWPSRTVTYCFREDFAGDRSPFPEEYQATAIKAANEWTDKTVINLVLMDFDTVPQPQIVISMKDLSNPLWMGWAYFPGKKAICGDIDIDKRAWFDEAQLLCVIKHEFGHACGLKHNWRWQSIMYKFPKAKEIHKFDIKNLDEGYE